MYCNTLYKTRELTMPKGWHWSWGYPCSLSVYRGHRWGSSVRSWTNGFSGLWVKKTLLTHLDIYILDAPLISFSTPIVEVIQSVEGPKACLTPCVQNHPYTLCSALNTSHNAFSKYRNIQPMLPNKQYNPSSFAGKKVDMTLIIN